MQKYFQTSYKILLLGAVMAISQGHTYAVNPLKPENPLKETCNTLIKIIENQSSGDHAEAKEKLELLRIKVDNRYNKDKKVCEIDGSSQENFERAIRFIQYFKIRHIRYRGPVDLPTSAVCLNKDRIVPLLRLDHVASLAIVNQNEQPIDSLYLNGLNITDGEIASWLGKLTQATKRHIVALNLSDNWLTKVDGFRNLPGLKILYLSGNQLTTIKGLAKLSKLEKLDLSENQLRTVEGLKHLPKLIYLDLSYNQLGETAGLETLPKLGYLYLDNNQFTNSAIENLRRCYQNVHNRDVYITARISSDSVNNQSHGLRRAHKAGKEINKILREKYTAAHPYVIDGSGDFEEGIAYVRNYGIRHIRYSIADYDEEYRNHIVRLLRLPYIDSLAIVNEDERFRFGIYLSECNITDGEVVSLLSKLSQDSKEQVKWIDLNYNQITMVRELEHFPNLRDLYLGYNQLKEIVGLEKLTKLNGLYLGYNQLKEIAGLEKLTDLRILDLSHNQLSVVKGLKNLPKLHYLHLDHNQLTKVEGLENFPELSKLDLSHNQLRTVKGLKNLPKLYDLYLDHNQLTKVEGLENFPELNKLYLNHNQLTKIENLAYFPQLKWLYLKNNRLKTIAGLKSMNLPKLKGLYLKNNQLTEVEAFKLANFSQLRYLHLDSNQLRGVAGLENSLKLRYLHLENNPLTNEAIENLRQHYRNVHNRNVYMITHTLSDSLNHSLHPLNRENKDWKKSRKMLKKYNAANPFKIDGNSQESFEQDVAFANKHQIRHICYRADLVDEYETLSGPLDFGNNRIVSVNGNHIVRLLRLPYIDSLELEEIDVNTNGLKFIFGLDLSSNNITDEEMVLFLSRLSKKFKRYLYWIFLNKNQLRTAAGLEVLPNLSCLDLSHNQISTLERLENFPNLSTLDLSYNQLTMVGGFGNFPSLWNLNLSHNQITMVEGLEELSWLSDLNLSHNQLTDRDKEDLRKRFPID